MQLHQNTSIFPDMIYIESLTRLRFVQHMQHVHIITVLNSRVKNIIDAYHVETLIRNYYYVRAVFKEFKCLYNDCLFLLLMSFCIEVCCINLVISPGETLLLIILGIFCTFNFKLLIMYFLLYRMGLKLSLFVHKEVKIYQAKSTLGSLTDINLELYLGRFGF